MQNPTFSRRAIYNEKQHGFLTREFGSEKSKNEGLRLVVAA
jgi:hypothetical protein